MRWRFALLVALSVAIASPAAAVEPSSSSANECQVEGQGKSCSTDAECSGFDYIMACVKTSKVGLGGPGTCQITCATDEDPPARDNSWCSLGETCVAGNLAEGGTLTYYCRPTQFSMTLNLLDQCVLYHLQGIQPVLTGDNCSLQKNLSTLLDQDADLDFDIFDLDLCVLAFLERPTACAPDSDTVAPVCDEELIYCEADPVCGAGAYCDLERNACARDCGTVGSREASGAELEVPCTGALQGCNTGRGRCVTLTQEQVLELTCQVDTDCVTGAYCLLGRCAPRCTRSVDCPDSNWYCAKNNRCRALPPPAGEDGFVFEPSNYAVRFLRDDLSLDDVQIERATELVVLDLRTKRQVVSNAAVSFGYRLEVSYGSKQDVQCLQPVVDCSDDDARPAGESEEACLLRQADCRIDPEEEWLLLPSPFGTVSAIGTPTVTVDLDPAVAETLTPGVYVATLRAIFDNGDSDTIQVMYTRASPSGSYTGSLSVAGTSTQSAGSATLTGARPITFDFSLYLTDRTEKWIDLMAANNIVNDGGADQSAGTFKDLNEGRVVLATLDGDATVAFARNGTGSAGTNDVPFVGIYKPDTGFMRLVGIVEVAADFCLDEEGAPCSAGVPTSCGDGVEKLEVRNPFGRRVRRQLEFFGTFDSAAGRFSGFYFETIHGMFPSHSVTLEGSFTLLQQTSDGTPLEVSEPLVPASLKVFDSTELSDFGSSTPGAPDAATVASAVAVECAAYPTEVAKFASKGKFLAYLAAAERGKTTVFGNDLVSFRTLIEKALAALADPQNPIDTSNADYLSIYDFVSDWLVPCDQQEGEPEAALCLDIQKARCALALHRKALLEGDWINYATLGDGGAGAALENPLFCVEDIPLAGCPSKAAGQEALFVLQEHNRFWSLLARAWKFEADRARTNAFLTLFRNDLNPFVAGTALNYKNEQLRFALCRYEQVVDLFAGVGGVLTLEDFPGQAFSVSGEEWTLLMHAIIGDRMELQADLVDLRRRLIYSTDSSDFRFAQHMMQHEYLLQVYLMALQQSWEKELFTYLGQAAPIFDQGQAVLAQLNPARNSLGVPSNRVFFENDDQGQTNWQAYRARIVGDDGSGGLLAEAQGLVTDAVAQIQGALSDLDTFEETLFDSRQDLEEKMLEYCGSADLLSYVPAKFDASGNCAPTCATANACGPDGCGGWCGTCAAGSYCVAGTCALATAIDESKYCQQVYEEYWDDTQAWETLKDSTTGGLGVAASGDLAGSISCKGASSNVNGENDCHDTVALFTSTTDTINAKNLASATGTSVIEPPACNLEHTLVHIAGVARPCAGGSIGALLQEKALVDLQRRQVLLRVKSVIERMETFLAWHKLMAEKTDSIQEAEQIFAAFKSIWDFLMDKDVGILTNSEKVAAATTDIPKCTLIAGLAFGTNCVGSAIKGVTKVVVSSVFGVIKSAGALAFRLGDIAKNAAVGEFEQQKGASERFKDLHEIAREMDELLLDYQAWTQESFNLGLQIADQRMASQKVADLYKQRVSFVAEHLIGRESGFILKGDHLVGEANATFRELVLTAYKAAVAFDHHYNLEPGFAAALIGESTALATIDDVAGFIDKLDGIAYDYCGVQGIDCDAAANVEVLHYSLRERKFWNLKNLVDPLDNSKVVTAGVQFHNQITGPSHLHRRVRGPFVVDQIEIPVTLPLTVLEQTAQGPQWLINPLSCNHHLDADSPNNPEGAKGGTVAVEFRGRNLLAPDKVIHYQLQRGGTDWLRACQMQSVQKEIGTLPVLQYPLRQHIVQYPPQNPKTNLSELPKFFTRSAEFAGCVTEPVMDESGKLIGTEPSYGPSFESAPCWRYFARDRSLAALDYKIIIPLSVDGAATDSAWIAGDGLPEDQRPVIEDIVVHFRYRTRPVEEL